MKLKTKQKRNWCSKCGRKFPNGKKFCPVHSKNKGITKEKAKEFNIKEFKDQFPSIRKEIVKGIVNFAEEGILKGGYKDFTDKALKQTWVTLKIYKYMRDKGEMVNKEELSNGIEKSFYNKETIEMGIKQLMVKGYIYSPKKSKYKSLY